MGVPSKYGLIARKALICKDYGCPVPEGFVHRGGEVAKTLADCYLWVDGKTLVTPCRPGGNPPVV